MTKTLLLASACIALAPASLCAQFLPFGTQIGGADDVLIAVTLPFMVTMPGGTATDSLVISSNGWIEVDSGQAGSDLSETVGELLGNDASIRAYWDDLDSPTIFLNTTVAGLAVVTWADSIEFANSGEFTVQVQVDAGGVVRILYDGRVVAPAIDGDCIVGVSAGGGVADPGSSDLSAAAIVTTTDIAYEEFSSGFDLESTELTFTPTSPGFLVTGNAAAANAGLAVTGRSSCNVPAAYSLTPTFPGYVMSSGGTFDANFASGSVVSTDDDGVVGGLALSFPFTLPGGAAASTIAVDTNGRILADVGEISDFSPTVGELLGDASSIDVLWTDMDPSDTDALGSLWFHDDGSSASVTWDRIPQFDGGPGNLSTFQCRLLPGGGIEFHYRVMNHNVDTLTRGNTIVGVSAGNGAADPDGESDVSAGSVFSTDDVLYEEWIDPNEIVDVFVQVNDSAELIAVTQPMIGSDFDCDILDPSGNSVGVAYFFGLPTGVLVPSIPLGPIIPALAGCEVLADIVTPGALVATPSGSPGTSTTIFPIPNAVALVGLEGLVVSAIVIDPTLSPTLFPTDELVVTIGG